MADRSIRLYLRAEIADFKRQMAEAAKAAEEPGRKSRETSERAQAALGRMVQSAHENRQAWTTAGQSLAAVGAATGAIYISALRAGVAYNTLQQTSRAALTTILGSSKAANEQMDRLDEFARNSPFAKQVFISAQRQMLGFGIEARKVIPYLDAIQNAVAAMGGSNDDIAGIAESIAKVQSQGKLSAVTFMELGRRGIDAATLIGGQMGKTAAQIRDEVTKGTLDAEVALDALAAGMQRRYAGAAANVKNTFEGAVDRVKAAWRDLASELAEPLVGKDGGGVLIDIANNAADAMRWFQGLPEPIKETAAGMGGLVAVGATLGGTFLLLAPRILDTTTALRTMAAEHPKAVRAIRGAGWAAAAYAVLTALESIEDSIRKARNGGEADLPALGQSLTNFARTGRVAGESARYFGEGFEELDKAFGQTSGWQSNVGRITNNLGAWGWLIPPLKANTAEWAREVKNGEEKLAAFDQTLKGLVQAGDLETAAALEAEFAARAADAGWSVQQIDAALSEYKVALEDAKGATEGASSATGDLAAQTEEAAAAAQAAEDAYAEWHRTVEAAAARFVDVVDAYDAVIQANIDLATEAAAASSSTKDSWEDFYDGSTVSAKEWISSLRDQVAEQRQWADNLVAAATKVREELPAELQEAGQALVDEFIAKGPDGADALATFVEMKPKQREKIVRLTKEAADLATGTLQDELDVARNPVLGVDVDVANAQLEIDNFITTQTGRRIYIDVHGRQTGFTNGPGTWVGRASGGSVFGPGTETSDSIPALLSNNEHVWSAREVRGAGGHGALERMRAMARMGILPALASGGRVGWARDQQKEARDALKEARERLREAERESRRASRTDDSRRKERARKAEQAAREELRDAETALRDARARTQRLVTQRRDLRTTLRRGTIRDSVTGGLSGALGVVDDLYEQSRNADLSRKQRNRLANTAKESEKALSNLYKRSEQIEAKLAEARDRVAELGQISSQVSGNLRGEFSLGSAFGDAATVQRQDARGNIWHETTSTGTSRSLVVAAQARAAKIRAFAGKLSQLQRLGLSGVVLQEIAMLGSDQGSEVADAMIAGGKTDIQALNAAYADIAKWSDQAGQYVTEGFYKGGLRAAEGLVQGLEDQQAAIEKQMLEIAKAMEKALKRALGIKSPSTKARDWMHDVGRGAVLGIEDATRWVEERSVGLGLAAVSGLDTSRGRAVSGYSAHTAAAPAVNVNVDHRMLANALDGTSLTLVVDGHPVRAIVQTELGHAATAVQRGY